MWLLYTCGKLLAVQSYTFSRELLNCVGYISHFSIPSPHVVALIKQARYSLPPPSSVVGVGAQMTERDFETEKFQVEVVEVEVEGVEVVGVVHEGWLVKKSFPRQPTSLQKSLTVSHL
jgi:hypothetical protein